MFVAIDDTDSRDGMCTTFLITEIIERSGMDIIGLPSLVRLNPAVPYKTRGNGSLAVNLGKGKGRSRHIGIFGNRAVMSFENGEDIISEEEMMSIVEPIVMEFSELQYPDTNPGIVISRQKLNPEFYWRAVREIVQIGEAEKLLAQHGILYRKIKLGRGIIGAAAALSWPEKRRTFEMLAYRYPRGDAITQDRKMLYAESAETIPGSFNNIDRRNSYAAIFPRERTPVIFGIRGRDPEALLSSGFQTVSSWEVRPDRILIFQSNQASDDHIQTDPSDLKDMHSYRVTGRISANPRVISGSHYFAQLSWNGTDITIAAFEPTKEFRAIFRKLALGDLVTVYGTFSGNVLNLEKLELMNRSRIYRRMPPVCTVCGAGMHSHGHGDYRCSHCGTRDSLPSYSEVYRDISEGRYDVPVIARRHLSRPFEFSFSGEAAST